jgi:hypothetical protein
MKQQNKKQQKPNKKPGHNKDKKYEKPLCLHGMNIEELVDIALNPKEAQK